jgi:2-oxoglutarate dehydrogenase E2 component (dihydrolipoamide succinyltransferase)
MASNVEVPALGESITEAVVSQWLKNEGDQVALDEPICELESDKATVDLPAPASGVLHPKKQAGETARVGEVIAEIEETEAPAGKSESAETPAAKPAAPSQPKTTTEEKPREERAKPKAEKPKAEKPKEEKPQETPPEAKKTDDGAEKAKPVAAAPAQTDGEGIRREPLSKIRRSIAERLVRAQQTAALLTTFNEIDMTAVQELRARHGHQFQEAHGVSLGLVSFFARASVLALKQFPILNAMLEGNDIVYHEHVHLGIAVSTDRGLIVPVLRNVESLSFARIEGEIKRAAAAARDGKLSISELSGGTFTITNGGVFGSLLSMPILNPPQTGILGMHTIQDRPVAVKGQVEIRPMMYVALTYDHRLVDGKDAVSFLVRLKHLLEDPMQMILEI